MTNAERAAQLWPLLSFAASNRQVLTYGTVGSLIGAPAVALGQMLEPIQSYCLLRKLPALTVLVVSKETGLPGLGFSAASDFGKALQRVFDHDWLKESTPNAAELEAAVRALPSNGVRFDPADETSR
jgi:hypothetical protein